MLNIRNLKNLVQYELLLLKYKEYLLIIKHNL